MSADVAISTARLVTARWSRTPSSPCWARSSLMFQLLVSSPGAAHRLAQVLLCHRSQEAAPDNDAAQSCLWADRPRGAAAADFAGSAYPFRRRRVMAAVNYRTVDV